MKTLISSTINWYNGGMIAVLVANVKYDDKHEVINYCISLNNLDRYSHDFDVGMWRVKN